MTRISKNELNIVTANPIKNEGNMLTFTMLSFATLISVNVSFILLPIIYYKFHTNNDVNRSLFLILNVYLLLSESFCFIILLYLKVLY